MKQYHIEFNSAALRDLRKINRKDLANIVQVIDKLSQEPRPSGCLKMKGKEGFYRIRVGEYRIIYDIQDKKLIVLVLRVRPRRDVYRK